MYFCLFIVVAPLSIATKLDIQACPALYLSVPCAQSDLHTEYHQYTYPLGLWLAGLGFVFLLRFAHFELPKTAVLCFRTLVLSNYDCSKVRYFVYLCVFSSRCLPFRLVREQVVDLICKVLTPLALILMLGC
ncbi:branched-chain amino acid transport system II carrier protein [Actinobacillus seminis]|uniref:branched-chain amino acid transport system II carrier protein n=1 Tax=Actinobacillus seminis TaxID=722 RepID=UPI003B954536